MQDRDIQRVYRACDFHTAQLIPPDQTYSDAGNVNSVGRLNLVIESVRSDTKHLRGSTDPAHADDAGGCSRVAGPRKPSGHARQEQQRGVFPCNAPAAAPGAAPGPARKVREEDQGSSAAEGGGPTSGGAQSRLWRAGGDPPLPGRRAIVAPRRRPRPLRRGTPSSARLTLTHPLPSACGNVVSSNSKVSAASGCKCGRSWLNASPVVTVRPLITRASMSSQPCRRYAFSPSRFTASGNGTSQLRRYQPPSPSTPPFSLPRATLQ